MPRENVCVLASMSQPPCVHPAVGACPFAVSACRCLLHSLSTSVIRSAGAASLEPSSSAAAAAKEVWDCPEPP